MLILIAPSPFCLLSQHRLHTMHKNDYLKTASICHGKALTRTWYAACSDALKIATNQPFRGVNFAMLPVGRPLGMPFEPSATESADFDDSSLSRTGSLGRLVPASLSDSSCPSIPP